MQYHLLLVRGVIAACVVGATLLCGGAARPSDPADNIELPQAFTAALNAHDVDAVVALFTDADSRPTVNADRYAWQKYEIRLGAAWQAALNIRSDGYG